jgi:hypothetical protein
MMGAPLFGDRRQQPRFSFSVSLRYVSFEGDGDLDKQISAATTVAVSDTGIQIPPREAIRIGSFVQVAVRPPERSAPQVLLAKTRWCRPEVGEGFHTGLMFLGNVPPAYLDLVERVRREVKAPVA